jgi:hypothetical protein
MQVWRRVGAEQVSHLDVDGARLKRAKERPVVRANQ